MLDADYDSGKDFHVIQFTPPGSGCSIIFGTAQNKLRAGRDRDPNPSAALPARHSASQIQQRFRRAPAGISVIARVQDDRQVLDLRTVFAEQEPVLVRSVAAALR
jgi:hypothetical protein